ncbi:MAG: MBOAT family O-acyltransferase [Bryobacteraceae bacterium]
MSYTEPLFLLYLAACAGLNRLCPARRRAAFLLVASYVFYLTWSPPAAGMLAVLTILTFGAAHRVEKARNSGKGSVAWLAPTAAVFLAGYLAAFKAALSMPAHGIAGLVMPLGISYYTFKLIGYVLEVHRGNLPAEKSMVDFAAYIAFFPQIVAGPIQRPGDFFTQLPPKPAALADALPRLAWGLAKKLLVADHLAPVVNSIYADVTGLHGAPLWAAFYLFPLQLYADFSGLTDIAIGAGRLLGITGPENFNRPFTASSISDFWRRWHMSLTNWLGDYVFVPLRMATREAGKAGLVFSITVNMVAIGLWHGLTGGYLMFGVLNAGYLIADALTSRRRAKFFKRNPSLDAAGRWLGWLLTFHLILIAEVFFRAPRVSDAVWLLRHLWSGLSGSTALLDGVVAESGARGLAIGLVGYLILELGERYRPDVWARERYSAAPRWVRWSFHAAGVVVGIFGLALLVAHAGAQKSPFLYEIF